ncbi:hypothetical protein BCON_0002g00780 [Botryotinia convoluta]|uniref:Uncharacterized protein n=1 Tax=Botryotinia convoluta TaxID=54673 RepID=A0A4Z1IXK6_9HELO|nr:hypothetical protein BCON_0002g00780 [Botryotinia convoluta]
MSPTTQPKNSRPELTPEPVPIKRMQHEASQREEDEYMEMGRDADGANDKTMTQERRANRKDKKLAESLSDLGM